MNNQSVQDAYAAAHAAASAYLEAIAERIQDAPAPDDNTNWGNVADMTHLVDQLRAVVEA